jgi:SAM-dependent methyltransferase
VIQFLTPYQNRCQQIQESRKNKAKMGKLLNVISPLHKKTKRDYLARMKDNKVECMKIARKYNRDFWDGDRRYGYGGYKYDGRWEFVAKKLIEIYNLSKDAKILDVGCGKGFLLYEFKKLLTDAKVVGFDISDYAIKNAKEEIKSNLFVHRAQDSYPFDDKEFDLVVSLTTLHNLSIYELKFALKEIERVGKNKYIVVESYQNEEELFNLQCWALTCESFFTPDEWVWLFNEFGYDGDYEFIFFE